MGFFHWVKIFVFSIPSTVTLIILGVYKKLKYKTCKLPGEEEGIVFNTVNSNNAIIMIHGRNGTPIQFIEMSEKLMSVPGLKDKYNLVSLKINDPDIYTQIHRFRKWIEFSGYENVILIGVSKGGLISMGLSKSDKISKIITVGSPLNGTLTADYYLSSDCVEYNQLKYNSPFCKHLYNLKGSAKLYHIVPKEDYFIYPSSSCYYPDTPDENLFFIDCNHLGLQYNTDAINKIVEWIF